MTSSGSQAVKSLGQTDVLTDNTTLSDSRSRQSYAAESNENMVVNQQELNNVTVQFRRLRNDILVNFRNIEDLFYDAQTEFVKLTGITGEKEVEDLLRKLNSERHKKEVACSELVKKIKEDLDELGEMAKKNFKLVVKAIPEAKQLNEG